MGEISNFFKTVGKYAIYLYIFIIFVFFMIFYISYNSISNLDTSQLYLYKAKIKDVTCRDKIINTKRSSNFVFDCNLLLEFKTNDNQLLVEKYKKESSLKYKVGDEIDIYYDHKTKEIMDNNPKDMKNILLYILIFLIILGSLLVYYRNNKFLRELLGFTFLF
jgi:hypothetical protein